MDTTAAYPDLNPFISTSVGETDLWKNEGWMDVQTIHVAQYAALKQATETTRRHKRTQVRFVRGAGGSGKSHLFTRLRRNLGDTIFYAYAANPPRQTEVLESFLLNRLVGSLRHPARSQDGTARPYSQLRYLAYALLHPVVEQDLTLDQLHDAWVEIPLADQKALLHEALLLLEAEHPLVPRSVLRCVLSALRSDKEHLTAQWLSGASYLTTNDLQFLGVPDPLHREDAGVVMHLLGKLASQAGLPMVLVMDQLDLFTQPGDLDEFQRVLFGLIDQSTNWVVFIGLIADRFTTWDTALTQALRGRIGIPDGSSGNGLRLPVIDVPPLGREAKIALLEQRLASPELSTQRAKDGIASQVYPLTQGDIDDLVGGGAVFPRHLLAKASERFDGRAAVPVEKKTLSAAVSQAPKLEPSPPTEKPANSPPTVPPVALPPLPAVARAPVAPDKPLPPPTVAAAAVPVAAVVAKVVAPAVAVPTPSKSDSTPESGPAGPALKTKVTEWLADAIASGKKDRSTPTAIELGERVRELVEVMRPQKVTVRTGDLRESYPAFDGSDQIFEWQDESLRVVISDAMRKSFVAALERVQAMKGRVLLLRHAVAPIKGSRTMELINDIKRRHRFLHLPTADADVLRGLGGLLASLREGTFETTATIPPAIRENVESALRDLPVLKQLSIWKVIEPPVAAVPVVKSVPAVPKPTGVLSSIATQTSKPPSAPLVKRKDK